MYFIKIRKACKARRKKQKAFDILHSVWFDNLLFIMKISRARKITLAVLAIFVLGLIVYGALRQQKKRLPEFIQAERRNVSEIVSATGKVVAENYVSLAFERGGKEVEHQLKVGDKI